MPNEIEPLRADQDHRFEARFAAVDRSPVLATVLVTALVGLAILKPWASGSGTSGSSGPVHPAPAASDAAFIVARPAVTPTATATGEAVLTMCHDPGSWRTATIETWRDLTVRVWRAIDPRPASGPPDPTIPIVPAAGTAIPAIGYCAPTSGPEQPVGSARVHAWRLDGDVAHPLPLRQIAPIDVVSPYGALFGPPVGAASWPDGVVVFRYAELETNSERWFGIEVRRTGDGASPAPAATGAPLRLH